MGTKHLNRIEAWGLNRENWKSSMGTKTSKEMEISFLGGTRKRKPVLDNRGK